MDYNPERVGAKQPDPRQALKTASANLEQAVKAVKREEPKKEVDASKYRTISDVMNTLQNNRENESVLRGVAEDFNAEYSSNFDTLYGRVIGKANTHFNSLK